MSAAANPLLQHIDDKFSELHPLGQIAVRRGIQMAGIPGSAPAESPTESPLGMPPTLPASPSAPAVATEPRPLAAPAPAARPIVPRETLQNAALIAEGSRLGHVTQPGEEHTHAATGESGISQIHNPWARIPLQVLDSVVGASRFGTMLQGIPGTQEHHNVLVRQNERAINQGEAEQNAQVKRSQEQAITGKTEAETGAIPGEEELRGAQVQEANARAASLLHPTAKTAFEKWQKDHPDGKVEDWLKLESANKPEHNETAFDVWRKQNPKGPVEDWLKLEASTKPETPNEYRDFKAAHPELKGDALLKAFSAAKQAPEHAPQALMLGEPDAEGNKTAQLVRPGTVVGPHALTPSQAGTEQVTADKADATAKKARTDAASEYTLVQQLAAKPSPTNDLAIVMRYIGATKPDSLGKLRLNNSEVKMVLGTRNTFGDLEALVQKVQNGQMLVPKQRADMIDTMKLLAGGGAPQAAGAMIRARDADGKLHEAPAGTPLPAGWKPE